MKHSKNVALFFIPSEGKGDEQMGLCSSCAVYLAKKGVDVQELQIEIPDNHREQHLKVFMTEVKQLVFQFKEFLKAKRLKQKETFQEYFH